MNIADRVKQAGTATSDAVYVLGGAAADGFRTFETGFHVPTPGESAGTLTWTDVPILVETSSAWQIITATVQRDGAGVTSLLAGVVRESSTGSALGLTGGAAVTLSVVPSYWMHPIAAFGVRTPTSNADRFLKKARTANGGLMALGPRSYAGSKHATAQGDNAYVGLPYEDAVGSGNWPEAGGGVAMHSRIVWQARTADATPEAMACYDVDGLIANSDKFFLDSDALYVFKGYLTAICAADNTKKAWTVELVVWSDGTPALVVETFTELGSSGLGWSADAVVTNAPDTLAINVTGAAAKTITWALTGTLHQHVDYN